MTCSLIVDTYTLTVIALLKQFLLTRNAAFLEESFRIMDLLEDEFAPEEYLETVEDIENEVFIPAFDV